MRKSKKSDSKVFYPETIPDSTPEIELLIKETKDREYNETTERIRKAHEAKQQRMRDTKDDRVTHTINTIIEWSENGKRTIPYFNFNFHIEEQQAFNLLLNKLKNSGCFIDYSTNPFKDVYHAEYIFDGANIPSLVNYKISNSIVQFPQGESVTYKNSVLYFKLGDGTPDVIDFSDAPKWRKVIESFLELRKRNSSNIYKISVIISVYQELFNEQITRRQLSVHISNIRNKKVKPNLRKRITFEFDQTQNAWNFSIN